MATGSAIKVLNRVDQPFWQAAALEPDSLSDGAVGMTWRGGEPAAAGARDPACLTVFAGGRAAQAWLKRKAAQRHEFNKQQLDILYPGVSSHQQSQIFCLWPNERWSRCGYSVPGVGQVCKVLPRQEGGWQNKLFFAGEYSSPGF